MNWNETKDRILGKYEAMVAALKRINGEIEAVRLDPDLSAEGKEKRIAELTGKITPAVNAMRAEIEDVRSRMGGHLATLLASRSTTAGLDYNRMLYERQSFDRLPADFIGLSTAWRKLKGGVEIGDIELIRVAVDHLQTTHAKHLGGPQRAALDTLGAVLTPQERNIKAVRSLTSHVGSFLDVVEQGVEQIVRHATDEYLGRVVDLRGQAILAQGAIEPPDVDGGPSWAEVLSTIELPEVDAPQKWVADNEKIEGDVVQQEGS